MCWRTVSETKTATRFGELLQPRSHVYALAVDIFAVDDDVAEIDPNAETDPLFFRSTGLLLFRHFLNSGGARYCIDDAGKLAQGAVAHKLDDATMVFSEKRLDFFFAKGLKAIDRAHLVTLHKACVT